MKRIILLITLVTLGLVSCKKDVEQQAGPKPVSTEQLKVPVDFKWTTTKNITLTVSGKTNGLIEIISSKGVIYWKSYISANQENEIRFNVPSYETAIKLRHQGQTVELELQSDKLNYSF
ncbi:MAG: hypothetical protein PHG67_00860 [Bacteroidales bacterium]|jgi:hypothetical protein|nr:hypothetical protein [Bacteroidales bacterium]